MLVFLNDFSWCNMASVNTELKNYAIKNARLQSSYRYNDLVYRPRSYL